MTPQINHLGKMNTVLRVSTHIYGGSHEIEGKTFIFRVKWGMWPLKIDRLRKTSHVLVVSTHIYGFLSKEIDGKTFIFHSKPRHVTPQNELSWKNEHCSEGLNTHLWCFQGHRWENVHFLSKPRHVTPQLDHLRKTSPILSVSTHIYGVSQEIDGKMFIFWVNLGMLLLKSIISEKWAPFWGFQHTFMVFPLDKGGKTWIFQCKPRHVTPQIDCLGEYKHCSEGFSTHLLCCQWT